MNNHPDDYTEAQWEEAHTVWILGKHYEELAASGELKTGKYTPLANAALKQ